MFSLFRHCIVNIFINLLRWDEKNLLDLSVLTLPPKVHDRNEGVNSNALSHKISRSEQIVTRYHVNKIVKLNRIPMKKIFRFLEFITRINEHGSYPALDTCLVWDYICEPSYIETLRCGLRLYLGSNLQWHYHAWFEAIFVNQLTVSCLVWDYIWEPAYNETIMLGFETIFGNQLTMRLSRLVWDYIWEPTYNETITLGLRLYMGTNLQWDPQAWFETIFGNQLTMRLSCLVWDYISVPPCMYPVWGSQLGYTLYVGTRHLSNHCELCS